MVLNNVTLIDSLDPEFISFKGTHIGAVSNKPSSLVVDPFQVDFENALVIPGLINSHDHLDFNCFSPLGKRIYNNYTEWGTYIHKAYKEDINAVLKIPLKLRTAWGMYKNLLAGVTTVVNHGEPLDIKNPLLTVRQDFQSLHSVKFQKGWMWKLNNPFFKNDPCVIHTGEGSDIHSSEEIDKLLKWNLLKRNLIGIHGVAMNSEQAKRFVGLVWCPESNRILLNKDAEISRLKENTRVVFGTDSTLTGNWNIWHHLRLARMTKQVSDAELYKMVNKSPAKLWQINSGDIGIGKRADLLIVKRKQGNGFSNWDSLFATDPEDILMLIHKGSIRIFDEKFSLQLKKMNYDLSRFYPVSINGTMKYVEGNLPALMADIKRYYPKAAFPCNAHEPVKETADA